jgi:glutamate receptor, ionotropic, invertebrate
MDRVERFDYTASTWSEPFSFVAPRPGEESRLFAFIRPFQPMVTRIAKMHAYFYVKDFKIIGLDVNFHQPYFRNRHNDIFYLALQSSYECGGY